MGKDTGKKRRAAAKKDGAVPKGAAFMPGVDLKRLAKAHEKEKVGKSKYRLYAARLRKEGRTSGRYRRCWMCPTPPRSSPAAARCAPSG